MARDIIKPRYPGNLNNSEGVWEYLASVGLTVNELKNICVKEGVVTKLNTRETVTIEIDSVEYENVPVWIHTDAGARTQLVKEEEKTNAYDYFKDSALMFPFPEGITCSAGTTLKPQVFVIVYTDLNTEKKEAIAVIGIKQSVFRKNDSEYGFQTYKLYGKFEVIRGYNVISTTTITDRRYMLYDFIDDDFASIPSWDSGIPVTPFVTADDILEEDKDIITNFLSNGIYFKSDAGAPGAGTYPLEISSYTRRGDFDEANGYSYEADGTIINPGFGCTTGDTWGCTGYSYDSTYGQSTYYQTTDSYFCEYNNTSYNYTSSEGYARFEDIIKGAYDELFFSGTSNMRRWLEVTVSHSTIPSGNTFIIPGSYTQNFNNGVVYKRDTSSTGNWQSDMVATPPGQDICGRGSGDNLTREYTVSYSYTLNDDREISFDGTTRAFSLEMAYSNSYTYTTTNTAITCDYNFTIKSLHELTFRVDSPRNLLCDIKIVGEHPMVETIVENFHNTAIGTITSRAFNDIGIHNLAFINQDSLIKTTSFMNKFINTILGIEWNEDSNDTNIGIICHGLWFVPRDIRILTL